MNSSQQLLALLCTLFARFPHGVAILPDPRDLVVRYKDRLELVDHLTRKGQLLAGGLHQ